MKAISKSQFVANPEMYLDMAREHDEVRIRRGRTMYRLVCESPATRQPDDEPRELTDDEVWGLFARHYPDGLPPLGSDEEEIARAITFDELLVGVHEDIRRKWAERRKK